jgi:ABC-2 type transport system permease protein/sodium transport system permease protein
MDFGGLGGRLLLGLRLGLVTLVSLLLFGLLPLAVAERGRVRLATGFRLLRPSWPALLGGLLLGVSLWPFVIEALALLRDWGLTTLSPQGEELVKKHLGDLRQAFPPLFVVLVFVVPALAEEWFFRGFLFASLRSALGPRATVVVSALLFGLFHLVATDAFALERLLPSTALGLVLGWVAYRSGSVVPGMVLHACHNGLSTAVLYSEQAQQRHLPSEWLLIAAGVAVAGFALVWLCRAPPEPAVAAEV